MSDNWQRRDETVRRIFAKRGLATKLARHLGIRIQAITQWRRVPADRIEDVQRFLTKEQNK